jgi:outer membrane protein assembly factor BamB
VRNLHGTSVNMMTDYGKSAELGPDGCSWKSSGCYAVDGVLYFGSGDGTFYALDAKSGDQRWRFRTGGGISSSPAIATRRRSRSSAPAPRRSGSRCWSAWRRN